MFVDYVTLMLVNMVAGLVILALFVYRGLEDSDMKRWAPAFALSGLIASAAGFAMTMYWPLPGPYNIAFGEMSLLLGLLFLAAAWATAKGWDLMPVAVYAFFAGCAAIVIGVRFIDLGLSQTPIRAGIGFILTGSGGIFAAVTLLLRKNRLLRTAGLVVLIAAAAIWASIGYNAYWGHMQQMTGYTPPTMTQTSK